MGTRITQCTCVWWPEACVWNSSLLGAIVLPLWRQGLYFIYYFCYHHFAFATGSHYVALARSQGLSYFCCAVFFRLAKLVCELTSSHISSSYLAIVMSGFRCVPLYPIFFLFLFFDSFALKLRLALNSGSLHLSLPNFGLQDWASTLGSMQLLYIGSGAWT